MAHVFTVWKAGELITVDCVEKIPQDFDFLVEFQPEIPPEPHSQQQHQEIDQWAVIFQQLLNKEKSCQQ